MDPEHYATKLRLDEFLTSAWNTQTAEAMPRGAPTKRKSAEGEKGEVDEAAETEKYTWACPALKKPRQGQEGGEEEEETAVAAATAAVVVEEEPPVTDPLMYPGIYAPSGFDIMKILIEVIQRPNQKVFIGNVDSSCALVLCDLHQPDLPIVYCSEPFMELTGYTSAEILGRNCRFLQAPDGQVTPGAKRLYTDDATVYELKTKINAREEVQTELRNFRKDGTSFINILTTIPITYGCGEMRYVVGFQVDRSTRYFENA